MRKLRTLLATTAMLSATAFENDSGWKMSDGKIEVDGDGNPIYIDDKGHETSVKYETAVQLRGEAANHRKRADAAEKKLKEYDGIDPTAARDALDKVKDVDFSKLVDAGKLDEVKTQMRQLYEKQIADANAERDAKARENDNLRLDQAFNTSDFLNNRLAVPADAAKALYRDRFKVEDGKVVPVDNEGNPIYSRKNGGEIATVDEAFEQLITSRPDKDTWLKAPEAGGTGGNGNGGNRGGGRTMTRAQYDALDQGQRTAIGQKIAKGEMSVVD